MLKIAREIKTSFTKWAIKLKKKWTSAKKRRNKFKI